MLARDFRQSSRMEMKVAVSQVMHMVIAATSYNMGLIACSMSKSQEARRAKELYTGDLFKKSRRYLELMGVRYVILSAKLGVIEPEEIICPYECTLNEMDFIARQGWAQKVASRIQEIEPRGGKLLILAPKRYREFASYLPAQKYELEAPLAGKGIGQQQAWLKHQIQLLQSPATIIQ